MEKRRTLSVRRSKPICGLLAQLLGDLPGEFRPARLAGRGAPIFIRSGRNESPQSKVLPPAEALVRAMRRGPPEAGAGETRGHGKAPAISVRRSKPICGLLAQLLGDLLSEVPPRFSFDWGGMNPPQSKALPPAKRLYAPCGAARRRRAQENARAWKSAGHSVSGARSQSAVYCPAAWRFPQRSSAPIFIRLGRIHSAPIQGFASGKTLVRAMRRGPPEAGAGERAGMEKRRTLSVRRSKPICGLLAQLLSDLFGEVPPTRQAGRGSPDFHSIGAK